jgi:hypothetical protein
MRLAAVESRSLRVSALCLFGALFLCYLALSPGSSGVYGYVSEETESGLRMMARVTAFFKGRPLPPMLWSRHGPIPVLFDIPFLKLGKFFVSPDWTLAAGPPLFTAALVALAYLWLRKVSSAATSLFLTLACAFGTMLWPYAYIGLEPKQSFFVLLAGYLGLARGKIRGWPRVIAFATVCGLALNAKVTGVVMWPAIAYLMYAQFRDDWRQRWFQLFASSGVIVGLSAVNVVLRNFYWSPLGGGEYNLKAWFISSKFQFFTNVFGLLGSPAKGLFVFAPILVVVLWAMPRAFRTDRDVTMFAMLVFGTMVAFLSILSAPYDETWGPRFLHVVIAPLLICIGAAWPALQWRVHLPMAVLAIVGVMISFLGASFYYGVRLRASTEARQNTMEWLTSDNVWNEITFNARLFQVWWRASSDPVPWTPSHIWIWTPPAEVPAWKTIDLRRYCDPQVFILHHWKRDRDPLQERLLRFYLFCLGGGLVLLGGTIWNTVGPGIAGAGFRLKGLSKTKIALGVATVAFVAAIAIWLATPVKLQPKLVLDKTQVVAGQGEYTLKIAAMPNENVVVRYSVDGAEPGEMTALLDSTGAVHFDVGTETPKGVYRMLAFKRKQDVFWVNSDASIIVK